MSLKIQAGDKMLRRGGQPGTLGAFAVHESGDVVPVGAEHTMTNHWRACLADPLILQPLDSRRDTAWHKLFGRFSEPLRFEYSLRIKEIREDLPAVLKKPANPVIDMSVVKYGWATRKTVGQVKKTDATVLGKYLDGNPRTLSNVIEVEMEADHGDSGALLLSDGDYRPIGILEAVNEHNPELSYFIRASVIARRRNLLGFYCPIELPHESPDAFRETVNAIVPDGYFGQNVGCAGRDWRRVTKTAGFGWPEMANLEQVEPYDVEQSSAERDLTTGDNVRRIGRLLVNDRNKVVRLIIASSDSAGFSIPVSRVEAALGLRLIEVFGW
jgi:hypothetical protein